MYYRKSWSVAYGVSEDLLSCIGTPKGLRMHDQLPRGYRCSMTSQKEREQKGTNVLIKPTCDDATCGGTDGHCTEVFLSFSEP